MKQFVDFLGDQTLPVIEFRQRHKYVNQEKTNILENCYTTLFNYEQILIVTEKNGSVAPEQIKEAADNGTPLQMVFKDLQLTIRATKEPWILQASGKASEAELVRSK